MSKDNHQQSVGGQGAIDGLSGSQHSGTEGADSGQGVNKGAGAGAHGHVGEQSDGKGRPHGGDLHGVGPAQSDMTGGGTDGNATNDDKNQPAP